MDQDRAHNTVNEIDHASDAITQLANQIAWADPDHDAHGNMITIASPADLEGTYECIYDAWNRLVEVKDGATIIAKYEYDALNRRTMKQYDSDGTGGVDSYRHFYYNTSWQILETRQTASAAAAPDQEDPEYQYVWSLRYIDTPICRDRDADDQGTNDDGDCNDYVDPAVGGGDEHLFYVTDKNMNVTGLVTLSGTFVERYTYDPYGKVEIFDGSWSSPSISYDNSILFAGYYRDVESGIYSVRNRNYHPDLGRWLQRDPLGYVDGMSFYEYVKSNPIFGTDPSGLRSCTEWLKDLVKGLWESVKGAIRGPVGTGEDTGEVLRKAIPIVTARELQRRIINHEINEPLEDSESFEDVKILREMLKNAQRNTSD